MKEIEKQVEKNYSKLDEKKITNLEHSKLTDRLDQYTIKFILKRTYSKLYSTQKVKSELNNLLKLKRKEKLNDHKYTGQGLYVLKLYFNAPQNTDTKT